MESWNSASEGKGFLYLDEIDLSVDAFVRCRKELVGWDRESVESMEFMGSGFSEMAKRPFNGGDTGVDVVGGNEGYVDLSKTLVNSPTCIISSNSSLESGLNHSYSVMESNGQDSSLIDLKLGRLTDERDTQNGNFLKERSVLSLISPTSQVKRARTMSSRIQTPFCVVYGCHKDLTSSKDYHKRHRVCEVHSKTPKVIVNGIEQRFCQQCSRFHLLVEFDDGKRSCRKRLAGHNERRRKPQFTTFSGNNFLATSLPKRASFLFSNVLPGEVFYPERFEKGHWYRNFKLEEKSIYSPQLAVPMKNGQLLPNGRQETAGISQTATQDYTVLNTAAAINELVGLSHSSCALSLLSSEPQDINHSTGNLITKPLMNQASRCHYNRTIADKPVEMGPLGKHLPTGFYSSSMSSIKVNHMWSTVADAGHIANLQVEADGFLQESDFFNAKYCVSPEQGSTVDLLQLSSHLQRVEQQRNSIQVKHENEVCGFLTSYQL